MTDRTLSWKLPTPGPRQLPISKARIEMRVAEEFPWTKIDDISSDQEPTLVLVDVNPGPAFYRVIVIDTAGQESQNPPVISAEASFDPPDNAYDFTATDSE